MLFYKINKQGNEQHKVADLLPRRGRHANPKSDPTNTFLLHQTTGPITTSRRKRRMSNTERELNAFNFTG